MAYHGYHVTGKLKPCDACALHKAKQRPVPKVTTIQASQAGERLYMNTSGPFPYTLGGHQYWLKFKDQYSGMSWNDFLKKQSEIPDKVEHRLRQFQLQNVHIQHLRCGILSFTR